MPLLGTIYVGSLLVSGTTFALFLGIASSRIEHRREQELELRRQQDGTDVVTGERPSDS